MLGYEALGEKPQQLILLSQEKRLNGFKTLLALKRQQERLSRPVRRISGRSLNSSKTTLMLSLCREMRPSRGPLLPITLRQLRVDLGSVERSTSTLVYGKTQQKKTQLRFSRKRSTSLFTTTSS